MILSKQAQRAGGLLITLLGSGMTFYIWRQALASHTYFPFAAVAFPAFIFIGLMPLLYPLTKEEWIDKHRLPPLERIKRYRFGQKLILAFAFIAGFINWLLMSGTVPLP